MKLRHFLAALILVVTPTLSFAQESLTFVSGTGNDANPGSRTAPCRTFAGAISKTAAHGVVQVLAPGDYGEVTITKSITINGNSQGLSVLVAVSNGITIDAADDDVVIIHNIHFKGLEPIGGSLFGINVLKAGAVHIEFCLIEGFDKGISFASPSPDAQLSVTSTRVAKCLTDGIALEAGTATVSGSFVCRIISSTTAGTPPVTTYFGNGFRAAAGTKMTIEDCNSRGNNFGIVAGGTVFLSNSDVCNNSVTDLKKTDPDGSISLHNNRIIGNTRNGRGTKSIP